ncbi:MAG: 50S ribosomal protein L6 [Parcubacteria group bacterium]|nr:50S ribosomal protein L6 [Parcubacteria group bacterium]
MSRIGKRPIIIPPGIEIKIENNTLKAKGPKGETSFTIPKGIKVEITDNLLKVIPETINKDTKAFWGTSRAHINNAIKGVNEGFTKELQLEGVGYRVSLENNNVVLKVGFINLINLKIPEGIDVTIDKDIIKISGISKEKVGQFAAKIKSIKPVEPYKGKGIHYVGERIRRKAGKKIATSSGT